MIAPAPPQPRPRARQLCRVVLLATLALASCQSSKDADRDARRADLTEALQNAAQPARVVAKVNGQPIPADALARQLQPPHAPRSRGEVLDELIVSELLFKDALAEGYGDDASIQTTYKQRMVQRMIHDKVLAPNAPERIPEADARAYYNANSVLYNTPELRRVDHILIGPSDSFGDPRDPKTTVPKAVFDQARDASKQLHQELTALPQPVSAETLKATAERWNAKLPDTLNVTVDVGIRTPKRDFGTPGKPGFLPATVEPFADAAFAITPEQPSDPVDTMFGTHVIFVREVTPTSTIPFSEASANIRAFLSQQRQRQAMQDLVKRLMASSEVLVDASLIGKLKAGGSSNGGAPAPTP